MSTDRSTLHLTVGLPGVGCWSPDERYALRAIADLAGADFELHYLALPEQERRARATVRRREAPERPSR